MKMRVLLVTPAFPPLPGGGERYVGSLARELAEMGGSVTVVTSAARREQELWRGTAVQHTIHEQFGKVQVVRCPIRPFSGGWKGLLAWRKGMALLSLAGGASGWGTAVLFKMARLIPPMLALDETLSHLPGPFDLVHGFNISWEQPLIAGWRYARRRGIPFIATPFAHFGSGHHDRVAVNSTMSHQRRLLNDADAVLVLTSVEAEKLGQYAVHPPHLDVIGGGLDALPPLPDAAHITDRYSLTAPFALFIGRANRDKGAIDAAQAILHLRRQGKAVSLVIIGQTSPDFDRFYAGLAKTDRRGIRPLGILSDGEKHALLQACVLLLMPSRTDSFGIVFLEAWVHGKPVIGADAGGIPGVIDDGRNGLLVPFGDVKTLAEAVERLLTNPQLRQSLGEHGRQKVASKYNWNQVGAHVHQIYRDLLAERK